MALNMYKKYSPAKTREWPVAAGTLPGTVVLHPISSQVGITLTAAGGTTGAANIPGVTGGTVPIGGAGNKTNQATVAVDGSWILVVAGVTLGDTDPVGAAVGTASGTPVYRVTADGTYSLTSGGGVKIGVVDNGVITTGNKTPVLLGANL